MVGSNGFEVYAHASSYAGHVSGTASKLASMSTQTGIVAIAADTSSLTAGAPPQVNMGKLRVVTDAPIA